MKTAVILVALFGLVLVSSKEYSNDPCELLQVDAVFLTTATQDGKTTSSNVTTDANSYATGTCSNTLPKLVVNFNDTGARWTLMFSLSAQSKVTLNMMFQYNADKMFPDQNMTGMVVLSAANKLTLSTSDKSFKCNSEQTVEFKPFNLTDVLYTLTLNMKNLQVQAFNLTDNKTFSEATECEQDQTSTSTPSMTTSDENSTSTSMGTTEASTSEKTTTEAVTTTEAPKAPINRYEVKDGNETCLIMQAGLVLSITYDTANGTETKELAVPQTATSKGTCAEGNETSANLTVMFDSVTIEFMFMDNDKKAQIEEIIVTVVLDNKTFPHAKTPGQKLTMSKKEGFSTFDDSTFFFCHDLTEVKFDTTGSLEMMEVKVQAYNLNNGNFSGNGVECSADMSTTTATSPATSPVTTPKPSPPPGLNNFSITENNVTCLLMQASLVLDITYTTSDDKTKTAKVNVPVVNDSSVSGTCGNVSEELTVKFFDDAWAITFIFHDTDGVQLSDDGSLGAEVKNYALMNVSITYAFDDHLPDAKENRSATVEVSDLNQFKGAVDGSYKCHADTTVKVNKDVSMTVSDFQYQAFQTGNSKEFNKGDLNECDADTETNSVVPIAVGAALAGLVVIVLIAYLIGRRKSRRAGYESV